MKILNKLTIKNLKLNKKRTIVTIIGIVLSTALICAVAGMVSSFQETLIRASKAENGNFHITVKDVLNEDLKYFTNDPNVESYYTANNIGYAKLNSSKNPSKPYLYIKSYKKSSLKDTPYKLVNGRLPETGNEIVISETANSNGSANLKIGDIINLNIGNRVLLDTTELLTQNNPYDETISENIINTKSNGYTIVGFMKRVNYQIEASNAPGYTAITIDDSDNFEKKDILLLFKNPKYYKEFTQKMKKDFSKYDYSLNSDLLRWEGAGLGDETFKTLMMIASVVIGIIIITSVFVIKNSFSISITEKTKQYGMLSSIGATHKQIKKNVLYEGFILGVIGIPIGILAGMFADYILIIVINILLKNTLEDIIFVYKVPLLPIIFSGLLAIITIYLSVISSASKSAKISPIDAIRNNDDIRISSKKLKTPKIINKLFKMGGVIAHKNLKRSKKKYRTTVISLVVSIFVFISLSSFISFGFKATGMYYQDLKHNYEVEAKIDYSNSEKLKIYGDILKLGEIEKYSINKSNVLKIDARNYMSDDVFFHSFGENKGDSQNYYSNISMIALGSGEYERFVKDIKGNVEEYKNGAILINNFMFYENKKYVEKEIYNIKVGESFKGQVGFSENNLKDVDINIVAKTNERPMGIEGVYSASGYLIVSDEYIDAFTDTNVIGLNLQVKDNEKFTKELNDYKTNHQDITIHSYDFNKEVESQKSMIILVAIFLYGFIIVIMLIGVTNIFNTITTNMNLRQKEFAMLRSIGMTSHEFNHMITLESFMYGTKSLVIGIPLGIIGSTLLYKAFANSTDFSYILPLKPILISVIVVYLLVFVIMNYSVKRINKQNIIETIRKDNI